MIIVNKYDYDSDNKHTKTIKEDNRTLSRVLQINFWRLDIFFSIFFGFLIFIASYLLLSKIYNYSYTEIQTIESISTRDDKLKAFLEKEYSNTSYSDMKKNYMLRKFLNKHQILNPFFEETKTTTLEELVPFFKTTYFNYTQTDNYTKNGLKEDMSKAESDGQVFNYEVLEIEKKYLQKPIVAENTIKFIDLFSKNEKIKTIIDQENKEYGHVRVFQEKTIIKLVIEIVQKENPEMIIEENNIQDFLGELYTFQKEDLLKLLKELDQKEYKNTYSLYYKYIESYGGISTLEFDHLEVILKEKIEEKESKEETYPVVQIAAKFALKSNYKGKEDILKELEKYNYISLGFTDTLIEIYKVNYPDFEKRLWFHDSFSDLFDKADSYELHSFNDIIKECKEAQDFMNVQTNKVISKHNYKQIDKINDIFCVKREKAIEEIQMAGQLAIEFDYSDKELIIEEINKNKYISKGFTKKLIEIYEVNYPDFEDRLFQEDTFTDLFTEVDAYDKKEAMDLIQECKEVKDFFDNQNNIIISKHNYKKITDINWYTCREREKAIKEVQIAGRFAIEQKYTDNELITKEFQKNDHITIGFRKKLSAIFVENYPDFKDRLFLNDAFTDLFQEVEEYQKKDFERFSNECPEIKLYLSQLKNKIKSKHNHDKINSMYYTKCYQEQKAVEAVQTAGEFAIQQNYSDSKLIKEELKKHGYISREFTEKLSEIYEDNYPDFYPSAFEHERFEDLFNEVDSETFTRINKFYSSCEEVRNYMDEFKNKVFSESMYVKAGNIYYKKCKD
jgi:hypothetical protein